jgi:serine/threonine-protein kinase
MDEVLPPGCAAKYEHTRRLAAGGFGTVHLARHRDLDRPVAIKLLNRDALKDPESVERFMNEARITASLVHPHIVVLLDHGVDEGVPWIAYEYVPATSLRARMLERSLDWREALAFGGQIASALAEAHGRGVLHRDVKPENVLVVGDASCKVADFGTAKWAAAELIQTQAGLILGTPAYLAPEMIGGAPATPQSDVYATGVLLYELLTGRVPFDDLEVASVLRGHLSREPEPPSSLADVPAAVDGLVAKALAKSRADRFISATALQIAIEGTLDDGPPSPLAAYRRSRQRDASGSSSAMGPTVRTAREGAPAAALVPEAPPIGVRRVVLALSLVTGVLLGLAAFVHRPSRPPPPPPAVAGALTEQRADEIDAAVAKLRRFSIDREIREGRMWGYLGREIDTIDIERGRELAGELVREHRSDLEAADRLMVDLESYTVPAARLAALRARVAACHLHSWCRRATCEIGRDLRLSADQFVVALQEAESRPFPADAVPRLRQWLDRVIDALALAAPSIDALDRHTALVLDDVWRVSAGVGLELRHFPAKEVARVVAAFEVQLAARLAGHPGEPLLGVVLPLASAWRLPRAPDRQLALARARENLAALDRRTPLPRPFVDTLSGAIARNAAASR